MNRKKFIRTTGISIAALITGDYVFAGKQKKTSINFPDGISALLNNQLIKLKSRDKQSWAFEDLIVDLKNREGNLVIEIQSPQSKLSSVTLHWNKAGKYSSSNILNDEWERTYGDVSWHKPASEEILPWYFMECKGIHTNGFGVKTAASAFCSWQITESQLSLSMDTRNGGNGVQLGNRKLVAAEIVTIRNHPGETAFQTLRRFTKMMCHKARMPANPVYGINDWYFTYGNNSEKLILQLTEMMAPMADGLENRPFSVIDAGWFMGPPSSPDNCCWGDRMDQPNQKFGDMSSVAGKIKKAAMRPGIWTRPLCGSYKDPKTMMLPIIKGREENYPVLDPSIPENLQRVQNYFKLYNDWGFELVKFDFTSFDIMGKWGFEMLKDQSMSSPGWNMHDQSKTNAEIILHLYKAIREAAGINYINGCNTFSHLSAGLFELNRIGDDTSGNQWDRTRKMGVNTLAFRGVQNGTFYAADPDCVGLTTKIPWSKNKQWMELVAKSGTPLFISAQPEATGSEQKKKIKECFHLASRHLPLGEPLDWKETRIPKKWRLNGEIVDFDWS